MRIVCNVCGAIYSAEAGQADADARQCMKIIGDLPYDVSRRALAYLALFRPASGRGLAWPKALRLLAELQGEVQAPHIQWEKKVARPNSAAAWGGAMERIIERPPKALPLKSHGYLKAVAYEIADEMDRRQERSALVADSAARASRAGRTDAPAAGQGARTDTPAAAYPETPERLTISVERMRQIREQNMGKKND